MRHRKDLPPPVWVDTPAGFRAMLARLRGEAALAIDTESNSLYAYQERVCLIQISVPGTDYLVDPLALADLSELGPLLADPEVRKVLHGAEYDLIVLKRDFDLDLVNLYDTMWASRILGWPAHGLADLLETHFDVRLNKKYQRANWGLRPLPPEQLNYARLDTHYLLPLHQLQVDELAAKGRWPQAQHKFAELAQTRWKPKGFDPEGFWHISGARDLDDVGRGVLRELYLFRDRQARREDRPPFKVLSKRAMLSLAARRPHHFQQLAPIKGISRRMAGRYGRRLLDAIHRGKERPLRWQDRPRADHGSAKNENGRPSAACQRRYEALRTWRNAEAEARAVEPDIILTNQILWSIAHRNPRRRADLTEDDLLARWQADEFGNDLLAVLKGKRRS